MDEEANEALLAAMQRWILAGAVAIVVALVGGFFGIKVYRQNLPDKMWVPLPFNTEVSPDNRQSTAAQLEKQIREMNLFIAVSRDVGLVGKWNLASDEEGAREIEKRLFVEVGEVATEMGTVPAINVGMNGKRKERDVLGEISIRLMKDVWPILGGKTPESATDL